MVTSSEKKGGSSAMKRRLRESFGWYGTAAVIAAYILLSFKVLPAGSIIYQLLNITGAIGVLQVSLLKKAYQPAVVNIIWIAIGVVALVMILR